MKFESLGLNPDILKGIQEAGFENCTPIQEQSLPECLAGKDVIAQSQTGTGKTAVFLLSVFSKLLASSAESTGKPRALVMVPTRELATQVVDDAAKLGKYIPIRSVAVYGGVEYDKQVQALKRGVELVVATPGRMIDLHKSKTLSLDEIEIFVIDEADRMFDMGFAPDIIYIAGRLPKKKPRQTMLFSATIDGNVRRLASRYMKPDPVMIEIEPEQVTVTAIDQKIIYVSNEEKLSVLLTILKGPDVERCIIFTNMRVTAERLGLKLAGNNLQAKVLTGDVSQERRQKIIDGMKSGKVQILVATDVAARGLHIEGITHVINYDLPDDAANYVHRIGRTARAGKTGKALSLVCEDHVLNLPEIEKYIERKLENVWIEEAELVKDIAPDHRPGDKRGGRDRRPGGGPHKGGRGSSPRERGDRVRPGDKPRDGQRRQHQPRKEGQSAAEGKPPQQGSEQKQAKPEAGQEQRPRGEGRQRPPRRRGQGPRKEGQGGAPHGREAHTERPRREGPRPERTERAERPHQEKAAPQPAHKHEKPHAPAPAVHHAEKPHSPKEPKKEKGGVIKKLLGLFKKKKS